MGHHNWQTASMVWQRMFGAKSLLLLSDELRSMTNPERPLSKRQRQLVELVAQGLTDKEIALELGLSEGTLRTYWDRLRNRYQARSRSEIIAKVLTPIENDSIGRRILIKLPLYVWTARPDGYVDFCNEWFQTEAHVDAKDCIGQGCRILMPHNELHESELRWRRAKNSGKGYEAIVHFKCGCDGEYRKHKIRLTPLRNEDGEIIKWLGYGRELAEGADEQLLKFLRAFIGQVA